MNSGYTHCACRDCFDVTIAHNEARPELCSECLDAGCDANGDSECAREGNPYAYDLDDERGADDA